MGETEHELEQDEQEQGEPAPDTDGDEQEQEGGLDEDSPPAVPQPATEEPTGLSEKDIEKRLKALDKERDRHAARISEIMAEDALDLEPCPRCLPFAPGFIYPPATAPVPEFQKAAVRASIGDATGEEFLPAPNARACDTCAGMGRVRSGSKAPGQELIMCPTCQNGRGWIQVGTDMPATPTPAAHGNGAGTPEAVELTPPVDPWGRPSTHPKFGVMPQFDPTYNAYEFSRETAA